MERKCEKIEPWNCAIKKSCSRELELQKSYFKNLNYKICERTSMINFCCERKLLEFVTLWIFSRKELKLKTELELNVWHQQHWTLDKTKNWKLTKQPYQLKHI